MKDTLYIIGNGFDIHHGLDTSYFSFCNVCKRQNYQLWNLLSLIYGEDIENDIWWCEFEKMLSKINYANIVQSYNGEAIGSLQVQNLLTGKLRILFGKWLKDMKKSVSCDFSLDIDPNALFFTFNYTLVLERHYHVRKENVWHIHGSEKNIDEIVIGHDANEDDLLQDYQKQKSEGLLIREDVADNIRSMTVKGAKRVKDRISLCEDEFHKLYSNIKHFFVMGFSFNDIDLPYIAKIIDVNNQIANADWTLYYHEKGDEVTMIDKLHKMGIAKDSISKPILW